MLNYAINKYSILLIAEKVVAISVDCVLLWFCCLWPIPVARELSQQPARLLPSLALTCRWQ
jgi:hypothetical protein